MKEPSAPSPPSPDDRRLSNDRRSGEDRRRRDVGPPNGVERRRSPRRRRRRRGGFGPDGRLELPKGKVEAGETPREAAVREVHEETGIASPLSVVAELPKVRYVFRTPDGRTIFKTVSYFLLGLADGAAASAPRAEEGIVAVEWVSLTSAIESIAFQNLRPVLEAARAALDGAPPPS